MAEAEQPERLQRGREATGDHVPQLSRSVPPLFWYQIRNRIRKLIAGLPPDSPVRRFGEQEIARIERLGFTGEVRGTPEQQGMEALPSVSEYEQPRYIPGATRG